MDQGKEKSGSPPEFTRYVKGGSPEDPADEKDILDEEERTTLEGPGDFVRGEIDVKEQMDRAADALEGSIEGVQNQGVEDSPRTELGASFKYTPGGIEEVEAKTDQYMSRQGPHPHKKGSTRRSRRVEGER